MNDCYMLAAMSNNIKANVYNNIYMQGADAASLSQSQDKQ